MTIDAEFHFTLLVTTQQRRITKKKHLLTVGSAETRAKDDLFIYIDVHVILSLFVFRIPIHNTPVYT